MKVKIFYHDSCKLFAQFENDINTWLDNNQNIEVISTNRTNSSYIILYQEMSVGNDADEVD